MPEDVLKTVQHLIASATASDGATNEARNAAVKACRLIRLHGLQIVRIAADAEESAQREVGNAVRDAVSATYGRDGTAGDVIAGVVGDVARAAVRSAIRGMGKRGRR